MAPKECLELEQEIAEIKNDQHFEQLCKNVRELEVNALEKMFDEEDCKYDVPLCEGWNSEEDCIGCELDCPNAIKEEHDD